MILNFGIERRDVKHWQFFTFRTFLYHTESKKNMCYSNIHGLVCILMSATRIVLPADLIVYTHVFHTIFLSTLFLSIIDSYLFWFVWWAYSETSLHVARAANSIQAYKPPGTIKSIIFDLFDKNGTNWLCGRCHMNIWMNCYSKYIVLACGLLFADSHSFLLSISYADGGCGWIYRITTEYLLPQCLHARSIECEISTIYLWNRNS